MKRILPVLILIICVLLSGCSYRVFRQAEETPAPAENTASSVEASVPTATPEPGLSPEEIRNRLVIGYRDQQQSYPGEDGSTLLNFSCRTPQVSIPGLMEQETAINTILIGLTERYIQGSDMEGDISPGVEALLEEAIELRKEMPDENWVPFAMERGVFVSRGDAAVLSFVYDDYTNRAGAHGFAARSGVNFDVEAGRELFFADLAADEEALRNLCQQTMQAQAAEMQGLFDDYASTLPLLIRDGNWYFSNSGLVIAANPYDIAPYAAGRIEFTISYKTLSGVLHERWQLPAKEIVQGGMDGSLAREQSLGNSKALAELKLHEQGEDIVLWANNSVYDIRINAVELQEFNGAFAADTEYFYVSRMDDGEFLRLKAYIAETIPSLSVSWRLPNGTVQRLLLSQSGEDGSLILVDPMSMETLWPVELTPGDVLWRDIDRDGEGETVELALTDGGCELRINGGEHSRSLQLVEEQTLWIANADGNSDTELLISGKKADGSFETRVFRLTTELVPVLFLNGEEESEVLPARLVSVDNGSFYVAGRVDILGSYDAVCCYTAGPQGGLTPDPERGWELQNNESWLKTAKDIAVTLSDGSDSRLSAGTEILLTGAGTDYAAYKTRDGQHGRISLSYDSAAEQWLVDGIGENSAFVGLPYKK